MTCNLGPLLISISNTQAQKDVLQEFRHDYELSLYKMSYPMLVSFISYSSRQKLNTEFKRYTCSCFISIKRHS
jgi:hypothetical protein